MGQTLSEPVTAKETATCANAYLRVGSSCMQGWRINMEDAHTHLLALPDDKEACFFAVYDGHGGARVSQYAGIHLHKKIVQRPEYAEGRIVEAIKAGFLAIDEDMVNEDEMKEEMSGTTAVIALIKNNKIYCGNVGDSRSVLSVCGLAEALSEDHKPASETEARRIVAAGGWVEFNRVNGNLALSRALGDFIFKRNDSKSAEEQVVTAYPDVVTRELTPDCEFLILACDGIWDVMSNQEVIDFCRDRFAAGREPEAVCEDLLTRCLAPDCQMGGLGCDNMTVVLVCLLQNDGWDNFVARCNRPRVATPTPTDLEENGLPSVRIDDHPNDHHHHQRQASPPGSDTEPAAFVTPPRTPETAGSTPPPSDDRKPNRDDGCSPRPGDVPDEEALAPVDFTADPITAAVGHDDPIVIAKSVNVD